MYLIKFLKFLFIPITVVTAIHKQDIPNPNPKRIGDIFDYLTPEEHVSIENSIQSKIESNVEVLCPNQTEGLPIYEMKIILVDSIDKSYWNEKTTVAKQYAQYLHNKFKVGDNECRNGILAFFALKDHAMFVSLGHGTTQKVTPSLMKGIVERMIPHLKHKRYHAAMNLMINDMNRYMNNNSADWERWSNNLLIRIMVVFSGFCILLCIWPYIIYFTKSTYYRMRYWYQKRQCQRHLRQIDSDKYDIEHGMYRTSTCPICLEENLKDPQYTVCGHGFCKPCIENWIMENNNCPICRRENPMVGENYSNVANMQALKAELRYRLETLRRIYPRVIPETLFTNFDSEYSSNLHNHRDFIRQTYEDIYFSEICRPVHYSYSTFSTNSSSDHGSSSSSWGDLSSGGAGGSW